jgi:hypothetical protein
MYLRNSFALLVAGAATFAAAEPSALAQTYGQPPPTYGQPPPTYGQPPPTYGTPQPTYGTPNTQQYPPWTTQAQPYPQPQGYPAPYVTPPQTTSTQPSISSIEIGSLYVMSAAYGAGLGIWVDAEAGIEDPGLRFVAPIAMGLAAPVGVYFMQPQRMNRGMPAAISAGLFIGAGEGLGIWSMQYTWSDEANAWGFRGLARSMALSSTLGGAAGYAVGYYYQPSPKASALMGSAVMWGAVVGSMIGYGSTSGGLEYGSANDGASLGGVIGYNVGLGAAAAVTTFYTPAWMSIGWMWIGGGIGAAAGVPLYLAYVNSDHPAKRGLILQGITTTLGIAAGGLFSSGIRDGYSSNDSPLRTKVAEVTGFGIMPVPGGAGVQMMGLLF